MQTRTYKLRHATLKGGAAAYSIGIPPEIGRALSDEMRFECLLTEAGILYQPVKDEPEPELKVPPWMKESVQAEEAKAEVADAWDGNTEVESGSEIPFTN